MKKLILISFITISNTYADSSSAHNYNMSLLNSGATIEEITDGDKRKPVIMTKKMAQHQLKNMREHLEALTEIVEAMGQKNFKEMQYAALKLASTPQMNRMCNNMGKATPGFTEMGLALHQSADKLVHYAKQRKYDEFVKGLGATMRTCTSCHASFKQKVVTQEEMHKSVMNILNKDNN